MPRKPRVWYPGAAYHIMCRGNHRHQLFRDDDDYRVYLTIVQQARVQRPFLLHAYCLMTNHVHLQIETKEEPVSHIMQSINLNYSKYFNKKYNFIGQLYQGRFRGELIRSRGYFLEISRYIHRNPWEAKAVEDIAAYPWSSYPVYVGGTESRFVTTTEVLSYFVAPADYHYQQYVENEMPTRFQKLRGGKKKPAYVAAAGQIAPDPAPR